MKLLFLTGLFPPVSYDKIVADSKGCIQYAADALQKAIIHGLSYWIDDFQIINLPYVGSYPKRYKNKRILTYPFTISADGREVNGYNVGFCNISGIKHFSRLRNSYRALSDLCDGSATIVLVYAITTPLLKACDKIKRKYPNTKIVLIVPDLPEYMSSNLSPVLRFLKSVNSWILNRLYRCVDGYVLLSKYMKDSLPINNKPWTVVEGIYNPIITKIPCNEVNAEYNERYILYTGTLARRYGVMRLVEAFARLKNPLIKLYICGDGDSKADIIRYSAMDPRIIYKGQIRREEALNLQRHATLLVNPRTPEGEFTKYSFPSKTMEYLASGVPTLLYRLPGIPEEYYEYCYSLTDLSIEALTNAIETIINKSESELCEMGLRAKTFIEENKNSYKQAQKIINLFGHWYC
jgi:glycosyltransferase involved in cell wall biosynthesis